MDDQPKETPELEDEDLEVPSEDADQVQGGKKQLDGVDHQHNETLLLS